MRIQWIGMLLGLSSLAGGLSGCDAGVRAIRPDPKEFVGEVPPGAPGYTKVQKIFDQRCAVCHSCFSAPCQLNLSAFEGIDRGANQTLVYDGARTKAVPPTRLFEDAQSKTEWQKRFEFYPVVSHEGSDAVSQSLLYRHLAQKAAHPTDFIPYDTDETKWVCPKDGKELDQQLKDNPAKGMPLGFPALSADENRVMMSWLKDGAPGPSTAERQLAETPSTGVEGQAYIVQWESFLNASDPKTRISARYIYEHLFMGHIAFDVIPGDFYRLVRSRTPSTRPVEEIATVRPYDDPETKTFYYRFRKIAQSVARKNHIVYRLNDQKLTRFKELFLDQKWDNENPVLPTYQSIVASNPFDIFQAIPVRSRAQFMLDDAYYHVKSFIHGPVCKGNIALNVIQAKFFIFFLKPETDETVINKNFLAQVAPSLSLPADGDSKIDAVLDAYKERQGVYRNQTKALRRGKKLSDLSSTVLTVYRHFDSADVILGTWGAVPKTSWVLDYPTFERIYYNLVAGFDVFGHVVHQTSTRRYMDNLRTEAEDLFLSFLPRLSRPSLHSSWYRGVEKPDQLFLDQPETQVKFKSPRKLPETQKTEFITRALSAMGSQRLMRSQKLWDPIADIKLPFVQHLPEVTMVRLQGSDQAFTLVRHQEHQNVAFLFGEEKFREPAADTVGVLPGIKGSYPNFFFDVPKGSETEFVRLLKNVKAGDRSYERLVLRFGVRRMAPSFWAVFDWFGHKLKTEEPLEAGILDLSRYINL